MLSGLPAFLVLSLATLSASQDLSFTFNGFRPGNVTLDGIADITANGILRLTNLTKSEMGHAYYPHPVRFKEKQSVFSFSTIFVFAIRGEYPTQAGHGIAFVVSPERGIPGGQAGGRMGISNPSNDGEAKNHMVAVELDPSKTLNFKDINDNHVGIDINSIKSEASTVAGYYSDPNGEFRNLTLSSGSPMVVWIDYNGPSTRVEVSMAPAGYRKPRMPTLTLVRDLSDIVLETMYIGFSSATGSMRTQHYVLGWSFKMKGEAEPLINLPKLPPLRPKRIPDFYKIGIPIISICLIFAVVYVVFYVTRRKRKFKEELEDWELDYRAHRFKFKDLYYATKGFQEKGLLGAGGFGTVYRGILPRTKVEVAVKRVSHGSRQGIKEFVAEIVSIGRMSHRNLVPLLGYCRRKGELMLVYEYMPNGSLDKYLYNSTDVTLSWSQRFKIIKGVASALLYLHEEWEQVVIHRDVKASNVLLDTEWNGRLGDFGLARLHDHGSDPQTTHVVGTLGYLAPEHSRTGTATKSSDVFAFGAFLLEVACGRRPMEIRGQNEGSVLLVDKVYGSWVEGAILRAVDTKLGSDFIKQEVELVLKLGLLCSSVDPMARPSMGMVLRYIQGEMPFPEISPADFSAVPSSNEGIIKLVSSSSSSTLKGFTDSSFIQATLLSGGR